MDGNGPAGLVVKAVGDASRGWQGSHVFAPVVATRVRLQGFPDDWLDLEPPLADSAKYRLLGNAVCVPVAEWIGHRLVKAMQK